MRQFLLILLPLSAMAGSYDNVWKMFHFSNDDVEQAMPDTKLDQKLEYVFAAFILSRELKNLNEESNHIVRSIVLLQQRTGVDERFENTFKEWIAQ